MGRLSKWLQGAVKWIVAGAALIVGILFYGWRRERIGERTGVAKEAHRDETERIKEDRADVREALETKDGGRLYQRGKAWIDSKD